MGSRVKYKMCHTALPESIHFLVHFQIIISNLSLPQFISNHSVKNLSKMANPEVSFNLKNKVAIVTGSGKETGIGAAMAFAFTRAGARVVINHVSEATAPRAAQVAADIERTTGKGTAIVIQADISTAEGASSIVDETLSRFGVDHIDILGKFYNAILLEYVL